MRRLLAAASVLALAAILPAHAETQPDLRPLPRLSSRPVCTHGAIRCFARIVQQAPGGGGAVPYPGYGPDVFHTAYALPCTPGGPVQSICPQPDHFGPQTVAIVDANGDATLEADLAFYDAHYGLPSCTQSNGCLSVVNQEGQAGPLPTEADGWDVEIALDVETVHAICQTCRILVVEASSTSSDDLSAAETMAAALGATEISNSWGGMEMDGDPTAPFDHPGVAITVSSGDGGWGVDWPANLPTVISVAGTTLRTNTDNSYAGETVWSGSGSGCSMVFPANPWQLHAPNFALTGCGSFRAVADVAADADPNTGELIYDKRWYQVGGTSLSSPLIAAVIALAGGVAGVANPNRIPYEHFTPASSHAITSGSTGDCGTTACVAGPGYSGPGGMGSPNGVSGFDPHSPIATPVPTPSPTPPPVWGAPFPTGAWCSYAKEHHVTCPSYKDAAGRLKRLAWAWSRDRWGKHRRLISAICGAPTTTARSILWVEAQAFQGCVLSRAHGAVGSKKSKNVTLTLRAWVY